MAEPTVQLLHHGVVGALLWPEHSRCAPGAAEGIVDVAHDLHLDVAQERPRFSGVDAGDLRERRPHRAKGLSRRVEEPGPQRRRRAAAAVVGGAAAQAQNEAGRAVGYGVANQLAHAVGSGAGGVQPRRRQWQSCGGGHFHDGCLANAGIAGLNGGLPRSLHRAGDAAAAQGL